MPENKDALEGDDYFDDIGKIGALLSSEVMCMAYCRRLNDSLIEYAKRKGIFKKMSAGGKQQSTGRSQLRYRIQR